MQITELTTLHIGQDALEMDVTGLGDREVLKALQEAHPAGVLFVSHEQQVHIDPKQVLALAADDGFAIELTGMGHLAAELVRFACDPEKAELLGTAGVHNVMTRFIGLARDRAYSKGPNQLHAVRFGVSSKVVGADLVEPGTLEVHPDGNVAKALATQCQVIPADDNEDRYADLENRFFLVVRHPYIKAGVYQLRFNRWLTKNLVQFNRLDFRKDTKGDYDGDTGNLFEIRSVALALQLRKEIQEAVVDNDSTLAIRGVAAHDPEAEMWGENIYADGKTTAKKLDQSFTKTTSEWINSHKAMGEMANKYTPFAYRISDICSAMASVGIPGAALAGLMGAVIEEDFYLGLSGGPEGLDDAMEAWFRKRMTRETIATVMGGLRKAVDPSALTTEVKAALIQGAKINQLRADLNDPAVALVHFAFRVGKGWSSRNVKPEDDIVGLLASLNEMAQDGRIDAYRETFAGKMALLAAKHLGSAVRNPELSEDTWIDEDYAAAYADADEDVLDLAE